MKRDRGLAGTGLVALVTVAAAQLAGCTSEVSISTPDAAPTSATDTVAEPTAAPSQDVSPGGTHRGPVSLAQAWLMSPATLQLETPSCHGSPKVVRVEEDDESVRVEVVTTIVVAGVVPACADLVTVRLEEPLGDRQLIDITSGTEVEVRRFGPSPTPESP